MRSKAWFAAKVILPVVVLILVMALPASAQASTTYVVKPGDTLYSIAVRFGTTVTAIMQANGLSNPNYIRVGQVLIIPGPGGAPYHCGRYYYVRRGDTMFQIGRLFGVSPWCIARANHLANANYIWVGQRLWIPCSCAPTPPPHNCVYIVRPGNTLYSIARWYGTTVAWLAQVNHIANPNRIYVGQRLLVPCR